MDKLTMMPVEITLYDENDEPIQTYSKSVVRWGILKQAIKLSKSLEESKNGFDDDCFDAVSAFVCRLFDDKFTPHELEDGADVTEIMACFTQVIRRANVMGNA